MKRRIQAAVSLSLVCAACGETPASMSTDTPGAKAGEAILLVEPKTVSFPSTAIGSKAEKPVTLTCPYASPVSAHIASVTLDATSTELSVTAVTETELAPDESAMFLIVYVPTNSAPDAATVTITYDDGRTRVITVKTEVLETPLESKKPLMSVQFDHPKSPAGKVPVATSSDGKSVGQTVTIWNQGDADLQLSSILLAPTATGSDGAFRLLSAQQGGSEVTISDAKVVPVTISPTSSGLPSSAPLKLTLGALTSMPGAKASLTIASNTEIVAQQVLALELEPRLPQPQVSLAPVTVSFGKVPVKVEKSREIRLSNAGPGTLALLGLTLTGHAGFRVRYPTLSGFGTMEASSGPVALQPAVAIEPGLEAVFTVLFTSNDDLPASGNLTLQTNDPKASTGLVVPLSANATAPVLRVLPALMDFGVWKVGVPQVRSAELSNKGSEPLVITSIRLSDDSSLAFSLDFKTLKGHDDGAAVSPTNPVTLPSNHKTTFKVSYTPPKPAAKDTGGTLIPDTATVVIESNGVEPSVSVPVKGFGSDNACPNAVILLQEGQDVIPQTNLHLHGDQSFAPIQAITQWKWTVEQPSGSKSAFVPHNAFPNPTFEVNVAGTYVFHLDVTDGNGTPNCDPVESTVHVIPDEAVHIELLWTTPLDPDETDSGLSAGSDLDLHYAHAQLAPWNEDLDKDGEKDPWFSPDYDVFWYHPKPAWGSFDPSIDDDPSLDREDDDGGGPENLNHAALESGASYVVGVHYWKSNGFGVAQATIRVYHFGTLTYESPSVELAQLDLWSVGMLEWPSGKFVPKVATGGSGPYVTKSYMTKYFNP